MLKIFAFLKKILKLFISGKRNKFMNALNSADKFYGN